MSAAPGTLRSYWLTRAVTRTSHDVKQTHMLERNVDKQTRWAVRKNLADDGVVSNLYRIAVNPGTSVHLYDLDATRKSRGAKSAVAQPEAKKTLPVSPTRAWRMYANVLRQYPALPPMVRVSGRVYAASPLPPKVLDLPKEYHELAWDRCCLRSVGQEQLANLPVGELKSVLNKMLPWALAFHSRTNGAFAVVREVDGKMVCTEDGISVAGLRIFRGTTASVLHVAGGNIAAAQPEGSPVPNTRMLSTLQENVVIDTPLIVQCVSVVRQFVYNGKDIGMYMVADASGSMAMTLWNAPANLMEPGRNYEVTLLKSKVSDPRYRRGDFPIELDGSLPRTTLKPFGEASPADKIDAAPLQAGNELALRLDTRSTVASEKSLWEEVRQHFGAGPFNEDKQRQITRAMQGTPVVLATNLRHTVVRSVRFDREAIEAVDPHLRKACEDLDPDQAFAVVHDYSVIPLQALHCCYDPRMRTWQEVTVPACSFLPNKRKEVLSKFCAALVSGLQPFGVALDRAPLTTKETALLPEPKRVPKPANNAKPSLVDTLSGKASSASSPRIRTILCVAITGERTAPEDAERCTKTATGLARAMRTQFVHSSLNETEALKYMDTTLLPSGELSDKDCVVVFVVPERDTRPTRWLMAECLRRGVMSTFVRGVSSDKKHKLLGETLRMGLVQRMATDPVGYSMDLRVEVPPIQTRNTLVVGVDTCHTHDMTTGAVVGMLITADGNKMLSQFWRSQVRGREVEQVADHFGAVVNDAARQTQLHEVVTFQDGDVYSELESMQAKLPQGTNLSFLCLHKRTHVRFVHQRDAKSANVVKGAVVQALTPDTVNGDAVAAVPSFFLQCHDCAQSTARTVQYKVHHTSPDFPIPDLQKLAYCLAHVGSSMATKLPLPTRSAHRLAALGERLIDANPSFRSSMIPEPLASRLWYL